MTDWTRITNPGGGRGVTQELQPPRLNKKAKPPPQPAKAPKAPKPPKQQILTMGRIVRYALKAEDANASAGEGEIFPLLIVRVHHDTRAVNGHVFLNDTLVWVTNVPEGDGPGTWKWPPPKKP